MLGMLKRAARAIFVDDIRLQRGDGGLRVALGGDQAAAPPLTREQRERARLAAELDAMQRDLARLLDDHGDLRRRAGALATVEEELAAQGLGALERLDLSVLAAALQQFEGAVMNWSSWGLACLRSKMAVAIAQRRARGEDENGAQVAPGADPLAAGPDSLTVTEGLDDAGAEAALLAAYGAAGADAVK